MSKSHETFTNTALVTAAILIASIVFPPVAEELDKFSQAQDGYLNRKPTTRTSVFANGPILIDSWGQVRFGKDLKHVPDPVALIEGQAQNQMPWTTTFIQISAGAILLSAVFAMGRNAFKQFTELHRPVETEETAESLDLDG